MSKQNLIGLSKKQLEELMIELGEKPYRGRQLFRWIYAVRNPDFSLLTDLSKDLRARLDELFTYEVVDPEETLSAEDGTAKYLYRLEDNSLIESVLIPEEDSGRRTVCVSSQVGCALGCRFCATGAIGFGRDLTVGEILYQLLYLRDQFGETAFTNIVFMGMGEPMLNLENVLAAIDIITDGAGLSHAAKKITISTAGVIPGIERLARMKSKVRLAVSLNSAIPEKRLQLMPITRKYPLERLRECLREYTRMTGTRVTFEYAVFEGFNHSMADVKAITAFVRGIPCKINILAYNHIDGAPYRRPDPATVDEFVRQLYPRVPAVTVRRSRGEDIRAACGQLAGRREAGGPS